MPNPRDKRHAFLVGLLLVSMLLTPLWATWRLERQEKLNRRLCLAAEAGNTLQVRAALAEGADVDARYHVVHHPEPFPLPSKLWWINDALHRHMEGCATGKDEEEAKEGMTPLMLACRNFQKETVVLLLQKGAEVKVHSRKGATPTTEAVTPLGCLGWGARPEAKKRMEQLADNQEFILGLLLKLGAN